MAKILVIESRSISEVLELILTQAGYEVVCFYAMITVDVLLEVKPDLIIVHQRISKYMTGQQFISLVKAIPQLTHIPVVLCATDPEVKRLSDTVGSDGFIRKPFEMVELLLIVEKLLKRSTEKISSCL